MDKIVSKILFMEEDKAWLWPGNYTVYQKWKLEKKAQEEAKAAEERKRAADEKKKLAAEEKKQATASAKRKKKKTAQKMDRSLIYRFCSATTFLRKSTTIPLFSSSWQN